MTNVVTDGALSIGVAFRSVLSESLMCLDTYQMKLEFGEVYMKVMHRGTRIPYEVFAVETKACDFSTLSNNTIFLIYEENAGWKWVNAYYYEPYKTNI